MELHRRLLETTGGAPGIRDFAALESAIARPKATFGSADLSPTLVEKAAALCFSLVPGHPLVDANKRVGHAAMETFLVMNGMKSMLRWMTRNASCWIWPPAESSATP